MFRRKTARESFEAHAQQLQLGMLNIDRVAAERNERQYEARIADLKEAHAEERRALNKVIDALAEQVEYLRAVQGTAFISASKPATTGLATTLPTEPGRTMHMSEEEEDLLAMRDNDLISDTELEQLRQQLVEELGPGVLIS